MFSGFVKQQIIDHAEQEYPCESCGFVVGDDEYIPMKNIADQPLREYKVSSLEYLDYVDTGLQAIVHSHPEGPEWPSKADMASQIETNVPACIVPVKRFKGTSETVIKAGNLFCFGKGVPIPDILGRPFRHGVTDCYALIKDWYKLNLRIELPEFPREWNWWDNGENMYNDFFQAAGCRDLEPGEVPEYGDIFLASIRAKGILNHAGILTKNGKIVHHLTRGTGYDPLTLSTEDSASRWQHSIFLQKWVRYDK